MREHPDRALVTVRAGNILAAAIGRRTASCLTPCVRSRPECRLCCASQMRCGRGNSSSSRRHGFLLLAEASCRNRGNSPAPGISGQLERATVTVANVADTWSAIGGRRRVGGRPGSGIPETLQLEIDSGQAMALLGWKPQLSLEAALARTIAWYRGFYAGADMRAITSKQIDEHCSTRY